MYTAHVEAEFEAAHANGPEGHKCTTMHGHSWRAEIEWQYTDDSLDEFGWGVDFGLVKDIIRPLDHGGLKETGLNGYFDFPPSAENLAKYFYEEFFRRFSFWPTVVRVFEGHGNSIVYSR